jgi:hypothetical protein
MKISWLKKKTNLVTKEEKDFFSITKRLKSASYIYSSFTLYILKVKYPIPNFF